MKTRFRRCFGLLGVALALAGQPAFALTPGQKLTDDQIAKLGPLPTYDIGGSQVRVIPPQASKGSATLLLNAQGVVGRSRNEVAVSDAPANAEAVFQQIQPRPVSIQRYEATGITVLKYADFEQAIAAQRALKAALPDAKVSLPVMFGRQVPN